MNSLVAEIGKSGYRFELAGRSFDKLILQQNRLIDNVISSVFFVADPGNGTQLEKVITELESKLGRIDIFVYMPHAGKKYVMKKLACDQAEDFGAEVKDAAHCVQLLCNEVIQNERKKPLSKRRFSVQPMSIIFGFGIGHREAYAGFGFLG